MQMTVILSKAVKKQANCATTTIISTRKGQEVAIRFWLKGQHWKERTDNLPSNIHRN